MKVHLIGGGLASLAAAAYLIKDGGLHGKNINVYEAQAKLGGCLAVAGNSETGYIYPGSRVFEAQYRCATDLFSMVPSVSDPAKSIQQEITEFNALFPWNNEARLVGDDCKIELSEEMGLTLRHKVQLAKLIITTKSLLAGQRISDCLTPDFFETNFWYLWSSIMAFVPEHSAMEMRRYILRFMHLLPDLRRMTMILRTRYNQNQAIIEPLSAWLAGQGVNFVTETFVSGIDFAQTPGHTTATALHLTIGGVSARVETSEQDLVMLTNGSQLTGMSIGSMQTPPQPLKDEAFNSWSLWKSLTAKGYDFGHPEAFTDHIDHSRWVSFTVTCNDPLFPDCWLRIPAKKLAAAG